MTTTEIAVIIGGALLGYWIISSLMGSKDSSQSSAPPPRDPASRETVNEAPSERPSSDGTNVYGERVAPIHAHAAPPWFQVLDVSESADKDEITRAYKQKISQYHPDKVATMGRELRELAEAKSKEINTAYDFAMKLRASE